MFGRTVRPGDARRGVELTTRKESQTMSPDALDHTRSSATPAFAASGPRAEDVLHSSTVGALPILNHFLRRMRLEEFLRAALPPEDRRTKLSPAKALLVLLRNLLVSREPIYGVGEWAARHAPDPAGPDGRGDRPAQRRPRGPGPGPAVCRRRALAGPGRGHARGQGVRRLAGRIAQRFDHRHLLRRLRQRRRRSSASWAAPRWPSPSATTRTIVPT